MSRIVGAAAIRHRQLSITGLALVLTGILLVSAGPPSPALAQTPTPAAPPGAALGAATRAAGGRAGRKIR